MRKTKRSVLTAATVLCLALGGSAALATPASAESSGHIGFHSNGWFLAETCYHWKDSTTPDSCDDNKPIGSDWGVSIPADATGVRLEVVVHGHEIGDLDAPQITDLKSNHCYEFNGYTWNPSITEKNC